jgi:hypothetical protein
MEAAATAGAGDSSFEPSLWDDFFVSYTPPCSQACTHHHVGFHLVTIFGIIYMYLIYYSPCVCMQMSEEWMRERADELKVEVHRMFEAVDEMRVADSMILVDALQRLGIDNHFQEEINTTMRHVYTGELEMPSSKELHMVALRFRLLRQHGFFLPTGW